MTLIIQPGDILMVRTNHFVSKLIRFGQRGYGKPASEWNHCGVCVGNFEIVEALTTGVVRSPISKYPTADVRILSVKPCAIVNGEHQGEYSKLADEAMRRNAVNFARSCVGEKYGFLTIFAIAVKVLIKGKIDFNIQGTSICSGLAARSLERLGYNFQPFDPAELTPAYLDTVLS
jgi:uncharacterized protein YycO